MWTQLWSGSRKSSLRACAKCRFRVFSAGKCESALRALGMIFSGFEREKKFILKMREGRLSSGFAVLYFPEFGGKFFAVRDCCFFWQTNFEKARAVKCKLGDARRFFVFPRELAHPRGEFAQMGRGIFRASGILDFARKKIFTARLLKARAALYRAKRFDVVAPHVVRIRFCRCR